MLQPAIQPHPHPQQQQIIGAAALQPSPAPNPQIPAAPANHIPAEFHELDSFPISQLEETSKSQQLLDDIVQNNPAVQERNRERNLLYREVEELATTSLSRQDEFNLLRSNILSRHAQTTQKQALLESLLRQQQEYLEKFSLASVRTAMQEITDRASQTSETLRQQYRQQVGPSAESAGAEGLSHAEVWRVRFETRKLGPRDKVFLFV